MPTNKLSRRKFLKVAGVAAASAAVASVPGVFDLFSKASVVLAAPAAAAAQSVFPFALNRVTLQSGTAPFTGNRDREYSYLLFLDDNRMLYNFRANYGLSTNGAAAMGGWEDPGMQLKGHGTGHYLSALAQAYASSGNTQFLTKVNNMVTQLGLCQDAAVSRGYAAGYLSAYPESAFINFENLTAYWAPYYTLHKIMAGLVDCYQLAGNAQALTIVKKMADWVYGRLSKLTRARLQQMWTLDASASGEYGGMNDILAELHAITGTANYLTAATYFDNDRLFTPMSNNQDTLNGMHSNWHIPQAIGALRVYDRNNNAYYYTVAENFWNMVTTNHSYAFGGNGVAEYFKAPGVIGTQLVVNTAESCCTYNMLKLSRALFYHNPVAKYMDYYEKALYNNILANQDQGAAHGPTAYFLPTNPGGSKTYSNDYTSWTCCHSSGMESPTKFQDTIYAYSGETLYVNLFIPSTLNWASRSITVTQATTFPAANTTKLTIGGSGHIALKIRVPSWVQSGWQVTVNGVVQSVTATPGTYATIDRTWANGDVVIVTMPMAITFESTPDVANTRAVKYGPIVLCCAWATTALPTLNTATIVSSGTLQWSATVNGSTAVTLVPFYTKYSGAYTVYFNITSVGPTNTPSPTTTLIPGVIEAESYTSQSGIATETCGEGGLDVCNIENGDWIAFNNFNFSSNPTGFQARVASATSGGSIEIRLDSITGALVGTCAVTATGGWQTYTTKTCSISAATGTHNLYLKFTGGSGYLFNVNWFQFTGGGGPTPTRTNTPTAGPTPTKTNTPGAFPVAGAYYRIINRNSGKVAEVGGNSTADGGNVQQWTSTGATSQQWSFVATDSGYYRVINRNSGKVLEVGGNSTADGGNVQQWAWVGANSQQWSLVNLGSGYYEIVNRNSGKVLDVVGSGTADGVNIHQWAWLNGNNQQWQIIP